MFTIEMNQINIKDNLVIIGLEVEYGTKEYDAHLLCNEELTYVQLFSKQNGRFNVKDITKIDPVEEFGVNSDAFYDEVYKIPSMVKHTIQACC